MQANRIARMRRYWRQAHRWTALSVGWLLALVGLVGAILIVAQPLDRWGHPQLFKAQALSAEASADTAPASLAAMYQALQAEFGHQAALTLRLPRAPEETLRVSVRAASWTGTVFLNPWSGEEQGRRGEHEGGFNLLFKFHSTLFLQDTGKAILAGISLAYLLLLVSGWVLWWPRRWPPSLKIERRRGLFRALFDVHRTGGVVLGLCMAVTIATGAYMAWRPLAQFVTAVSGQKETPSPKLDARSSREGGAITLDELLSRAQAQFPDDLLTIVQIPAEPNRPIRVRVRLDDDPHPNGRTSVWLHPQHGEVLAVDRWNQVDLGARAFSFVYPLHTGELGGLALETLVFFNGVLLGLLAVSGTWLWWRRRGNDSGVAK